MKPMITEIQNDMETDRFDLAAEKIYHFIWDHFASQVIEESKPLLAGGEAERVSRQRMLTHYLVTSVKLLHPFMPYVTEAIWQELPKHMKDTEILMVSRWPK
jgi:valyl-tRNA synthetase